MLNKIHIKGFFFFAIICLSGCTLLKSGTTKLVAITQCSFSLENVSKKISFNEQTNNIWNYVVEFNIIADNPTNENISLGRYSLDIFTNDKYLSNITTETSIKLPANQRTVIIAKTIISPSGVIGIFFKKLFDQPIKYKINGTFYLTLGNFTYPFKTELIKFTET